jgi:hypothetical protein
MRRHGRSIRAMVVRRVLALCLLGLAPLAAVGCMGGEEAAPAGGGVDAETRALPSYRLFSAWLAAFNRGDRERYQQFLDKSFPSRAALVTQEMGFRDLTGGFDLRKIEKASATELTGLVQERARPARSTCRRRSAPISPAIPTATSPGRSRSTSC